jgi:hypothetical protein
LPTLKHEWLEKPLLAVLRRPALKAAPARAA